MPLTPWEIEAIESLDDLYLQSERPGGDTTTEDSEA